MREDLTIRSGVPGDALVCVAILNDWIDALDWLLRVRAREGFVKVRREEGANDEGLPDILYRWAA